MKTLAKSVLIIPLIALAGCEQKTDKAAIIVSQQQTADRYDRSRIDLARIKQGRQLYLKNCTVCHGLQAEGTQDWRQRDKDGKWPAPPLNGTGHAWHHPKKALIYTIKNGTAALGGNMPAWKGKLTDEQIESIILWFQSQWPEELYQAWVRRDRQSLAQ